MYIKKQLQQCLILLRASWLYHYINTLYLSRLISYKKNSGFLLLLLFLFCFVSPINPTYFGRTHFNHELKVQAGWYC